MSKFDERTLRMRKERIDLFGDGSGVTAVISRPERRALTYREAVPGMIEQLANATPPALCFDPNCKTEVRSLDGVFIFVASADKHAPPMALVACPTCSKKSNEEILPILRADLAAHFMINQGKTLDQIGTVPMVEENILMGNIHGMQVAMVGDDTDPSSIGAAFCTLLENRKLPRFAFAFRGHNNCYAITRQLYLDFKDLGIQHLFTYKEGFSSLLKSDGEPLGNHSWIEADGWVIDAANGAYGNPVMIKRIAAYYDTLKLTDIKDRTQRDDFKDEAAT